MPRRSPEQIKSSEAQCAINVRRRAGEGFIYVAELLGYEGIIKIGHSLTPHARMSQLKVIRGDRLRARLLAVTPGTFADEHLLHGALSRHRHPARLGNEYYPRSILTHAAIPAELRSVA